MKTTINIPQPVTVIYDDQPFYDMVEQYDNLNISDEDAAVLLNNAAHYINVEKAVIDINNVPPMTYDDIVLICQQEILRKLIYKYQL